MKRFAALPLLLLAACGTPEATAPAVAIVEHESAIINGMACGLQEEPTAVALVVDAAISFGGQRLEQRAVACTGTIIAPDVVLTAAHCVAGAEEHRVHFRDESGEPVLIEPAAKALHPGYNKNAIDTPVGSFEELMTRPDLKGRISLLKEMRDTMAFMLKITGADPADFDDTEWDAAVEKLETGVKDGQVRRFTGLWEHNKTRELEVVEELGLDASINDVATTSEVDEQLRASHQRAMDLVGDDVGTPVISVNDVAFFGPVITPAPKGEAAGQLWDGCVLVAGTPGFYELKRTRDAHPDFS